MEERKAFQNRAFEAVLGACIVAVLIANYVLLRQNQTLRKTVGFERVEVGKQLTRLSGQSMNGQNLPIDMPVQPGNNLLLITFATGCPFCQQSQDSWRALESAVRMRPGWSVAWVSRDPLEVTRPYCERNHVPFQEAVAEPPYGTYMQLGLRAVPSTMIIGPGGVVKKVWHGAFDQPRLHDWLSFVASE